MGERTLYLVRHGELDLEAFARDQVSAGLTITGREQARRTGEKLSSLEVSAIHCSTIKRARETAEIIANEFRRLPLRPSALLREIPNPAPVDNEALRNSFAEAWLRAEQAFSKYVRPTRFKSRIEIIVCHGNVIRYFVCRAMGVDPESMGVLGTSHCGVTQLRITPERKVRVVSYNETIHLPDRLRT